jgi:CDP-diacylglycerol--glycerol-3-phosphate 3-phosphatidyltransferase
MPSIYQLKAGFQNLLRPIVNRLAAFGVTANQVTISAIVLSALGGLVVALFPDRPWSFLFLIIILFVRMALNAADGMLAREHAMQSKLGTLLNELGDVISDVALYLPFALISGAAGPLVICVVILAILTEMTGVVGVQLGGRRRYEGPMGKSDRTIAFGILALLLALGIPADNWINIFFAVMSALLIVTIYNRARSALRDVHGHG